MIQKVIRFIKRTEYSLGVTQQKSMCLLLKVIKAELEVQRICVSGGAHGYLFMIKDLELQLTLFPHWNTVGTIMASLWGMLTVCWEKCQALYRH